MKINDSYLQRSGGGGASYAALENVEAAGAAVAGLLCLLRDTIADFAVVAFFAFTAGVTAVTRKASEAATVVFVASRPLSSLVVGNVEML